MESLGGVDATMSSIHGSHSTNGAPSTTMIPIGSILYKEFPPHGVFQGRVVSAHRPKDDDSDSDRAVYYRIVYTDGDEEDMDQDELVGLLHQKSDILPAMSPSRPSTTPMTVPSTTTRVVSDDRATSHRGGGADWGDALERLATIMSSSSSSSSNGNAATPQVVRELSLLCTRHQQHQTQPAIKEEEDDHDTATHHQEHLTTLVQALGAQVVLPASRAQVLTEALQVLESNQDLAPSQQGRLFDEVRN